jgi:hypothetical protein
VLRPAQEERVGFPQLSQRLSWMLPFFILTNATTNQESSFGHHSLCWR